MARLQDLQRKLDASLKGDGKPAPGYAKRARAISAEIARLGAPAPVPAEPEPADAPAEPSA